MREIHGSNCEKYEETKGESVGSPRTADRLSTATTATATMTDEDKDEVKPK